MTLVQIQEDVHRRTEAVAAAHGAWPCRKGCDDCCRNLAAPPRVTREEWVSIAAAIDSLPAATAEVARRRIGESAHQTRPIICPLLDLDSGACLVYAARPVVCRAYGFYADRDGVLGCARIETIARESGDVIWGNYEALEDRLAGLGTKGEFPVFSET